MELYVVLAFFNQYFIYVNASFRFFPGYCRMVCSGVFSIRLSRFWNRACDIHFRLLLPSAVTSTGTRRVVVYWRVEWREGNEVQRTSKTLSHRHSLTYANKFYFALLCPEPTRAMNIASFSLPFSHSPFSCLCHIFLLARDFFTRNGRARIMRRIYI